MKNVALLTKKKVSTFFSSLANETRLSILLSLVDGKKSVSGIHEFVGKKRLSLSAISHQLRFLSNLGVIKNEKIGKERFYELSEKFCWCVLKDAFNQFGNKIEIVCKKCCRK
ncbi:MAG: metalloregulator ArsR/SmtB family transcription factor [Candidatus Pacearchaeota archaeon]